MTKNQELSALADFIKFLGPDTYLGPILKAEFVAIEHAIRSDFVPVGLIDSIKRHTEALAELSRDCAGMRSQIDANAKRLAAQEDASHRARVSLANAAAAFERLQDAARVACANARDAIAEG